MFAVLYQNLPFEAALDKLASMGAEAVEIGTGNYPGDGHCRPAELLADHAAARHFKDAVTSRGLTISALSQHGNPLHPGAGHARAAHETWRATLRAVNYDYVLSIVHEDGLMSIDEGLRKGLDLLKSITLRGSRPRCGGPDGAPADKNRIRFCHLMIKVLLHISRGQRATWDKPGPRVNP